MKKCSYCLKDLGQNSSHYCESCGTEIPRLFYIIKEKLGRLWILVNLNSGILALILAYFTIMGTSTAYDEKFIFELADRSIVNGYMYGGDYIAFKTLLSKSKDWHFYNINVLSQLYLRELALEQIKKVETEMRNISGSLCREDSLDGLKNEVRKGRALTNTELVGFLQSDNDWRTHFRAAKLLEDRRVREVPQALINAIKCDNSLLVKKIALESFEAIAKNYNFVKKDIFDFQSAITWWEKKDNRDKINKLKSDSSINLKEECNLK